jgi:hypothetical protein
MGEIGICLQPVPGGSPGGGPKRSTQSSSGGVLTALAPAVRRVAPSQLPSSFLMPIQSQWGNDIPSGFAFSPRDETMIEWVGPTCLRRAWLEITCGCLIDWIYPFLPARQKLPENVAVTSQKTL